MAYVRVLERDGQQFVFASQSDWSESRSQIDGLLVVDEQLRSSYRQRPFTDDEFEPAIGSLLKGERFKAFLTAPNGAFPLAVLPSILRREFPNHRFLALTGKVAMKMAEKHADITARKYRRIQFMLLTGQVRRPTWDVETTRVIYHQRRWGRWWRLVLRFPPNQNAAELVTYYRITERAFLTAMGLR